MLLLVVVDSTLRLEGGGESAARGRSSEPLFRCIAMVGTFELDVLKRKSKSNLSKNHWKSNSGANALYHVIHPRKLGQKNVLLNLKYY